MPTVSDDLLAKYERDWGEAMEQYEASLTAERMANVNYDPSSRTFAASQPAGSPERLRAAFLDPVAAKWGPLLGRSGAATKPTTPRLFQTSAGVFSVDPMTGANRKIIDVPPRSGARGAQDPADKEAAAVRSKRLTSDLSLLASEMAEQRKALAAASKITDKNKRYNAELRANSNLMELNRRRDALFAATPEAAVVEEEVNTPVTWQGPVYQGRTYFGNEVDDPFAATVPDQGPPLSAMPDQGQPISAFNAPVDDEALLTQYGFDPAQSGRRDIGYDDLLRQYGFDPFQSGATNAPPPVASAPPPASSARRFKWVQGQLQPQ